MRRIIDIIKMYLTNNIEYIEKEKGHLTSSS